MSGFINRDGAVILQAKRQVLATITAFSLLHVATMFSAFWQPIIGGFPCPRKLLSLCLQATGIVVGFNTRYREQNEN